MRFLPFCLLWSRRLDKIQDPRSSPTLVAKMQLVRATPLSCSVDDDFCDDPKSVNVIAMDDSPLAWGYLPAVEPLETIPGTSTVRDAILRHVSRNGYRRPAENVERR